MTAPSILKSPIALMPMMQGSAAEHVSYNNSSVYRAVTVFYFPQAQCANGELSLVDGFSDYEGRLEMCYNNVWGTICDDYWTQSSTNVACRKLGLGVSTHSVYFIIFNMQFWV